MLDPEQKKFNIQPADKVLDIKSQLKNVFYDTATFCHEEPVLSEAVRFGLAHTEVYKAKDYPALPVNPEKACVVELRKNEHLRQQCVFTVKLLIKK